MADDDLSTGWEEIYDAMDVETTVSTDTEEPLPDYSNQLPDDDDNTTGYRIRPDWMGRETYASNHGDFAPYW